MRYTENEFKIDHIFDFIRIFFSSIFLAPYRLLNEYSKKILLLDKRIIKYNMLVAIGFNILFLAREIYKIFTNPLLQISDSYLIDICISLVIIMVVYYVTSIFDKPVLTENVKGYDIDTKEVNKEIFMDDNDIISDEMSEEELRLAMALDDDDFNAIRVEDLEDIPVQNTSAVNYDEIEDTDVNVLLNIHNKMESMTFNDPLEFEDEDDSFPSGDNNLMNDIRNDDINLDEIINNLNLL